MTPSNKNGKVHRDLVIKHSLQLSGRGIFATQDIKAGEHIMVVRSQAVNLGFNSEIDRLAEMSAFVLLRAYHGTEEDREYLHQWILTGQMSNIIDRWPQEGTRKVLDLIGGPEILDALELHPMHVGRLGAVIDLNSFLVESYYAERKGMGYWPEAGYFNHSCAPNCDYDIIPSHKFAESEFCPKEENEETGAFEDMAPELQRVAAAKTEPKQVITIEEKEMEELERDLIDNPSYLFCVKACRDIKAGEELLISYVPTGWRYDDRQFVLHDRYRFWCKCPNCATLVEKKLRFPMRVAIAIIVFYSSLQLFLYKARAATYGRWDDAVRSQGYDKPLFFDEGRYVN
jgi:endogenous inhibitor of DNA gyrase (YacG/DUF329 family)